jgi:hypothetical protein
VSRTQPSAPVYLPARAIGAGDASLDDGLRKVNERKLLALQRGWTMTLLRGLDRAIEFAGATPLTEVVAKTWCTLAREHERVRRVLDANIERSSQLRNATDLEYRMLALAAGLAGLDDEVRLTAQVGQRFRDSILLGDSSHDVGPTPRSEMA